MAGGKFTDGFKQGLITSGLNHVAHSIRNFIQKSKFVVAGIYGAGGEEAGDNPLLKEIVSQQGGEMFTSLLGENDAQIIEYLVTGYSAGKGIKIYGYSRGEMLP